MFTKQFDDYVCVGDSIACDNDGFSIEARIVHDEYNEAPDERQDCFWPSKSPDDAGYIGKNPVKSYDEQMKESQDIMDAWKNDEWFYCGIVLSVSKNGILLHKLAASLWGIECNYPNGDKNKYLSEVANELLPEALQTGKQILRNLTKGN